MGGRISVRVVPRSDREGIEIDKASRLCVRVRAAPVDNAANEAVVRVVSEALALRRGAVRIVVGQKSRDKVVEVEGMTSEELQRRLSVLAGRRSQHDAGPNRDSSK